MTTRLGPADGVRGAGRPADGPRTAAIPAVVYSALADAASQARAAGLGARGYLVKGRATLDDLEAAVGRHPRRGAGVAAA